MTSIGAYAFDGCNNLETVISSIDNVFRISSTTFPRSVYIHGVLYVPEGTARKYKVTEGWLEFNRIEEGIPSSITLPNNSTSEPTETERYTLDGKQITTPQRGINVVKMSDGTVKKVLVK